VVAQLNKEFWDFIKPAVRYKAAPNPKPCVTFGNVRVFYTGNLLGPCSNRSHNYTPCLQAEFSIRNTKTHRGVMTTDTNIISYFLHSCYISRQAFSSCPALLKYICLSSGDNKLYILTLVLDILPTISVSGYSSCSSKSSVTEIRQFLELRGKNNKVKLLARPWR